MSSYKMKEAKPPRITTNDLKMRYEAIKDGLEIEDEKILEMLMDTIAYDEQGIAIVIKLESSIKTLKDYYESIKRKYLSKLDLKDIYKYKELDIEEWDFLSKDEEETLFNIKFFIRKQKREYMLARADLMILRKAVIDFIENYISKNNIKTVPFDIITKIINNYTYKDSMFNLGYDIEHTQVTDEVTMRKLHLDEKTLRYTI